MRLTRMLVLLFLASAVGVIRADPPGEVLALLQKAADALTNQDAPDFLDYFDHNMPHYATLRGNIEGLMAAYDVESTIEFVSDEGDNQKRTLTLDWTLVTEEKAAQRGDQVTRRHIVNCTVERRGKKWKITAIEPLDFFKY